MRLLLTLITILSLEYAFFAYKESLGTPIAVRLCQEQLQQLQQLQNSKWPAKKINAICSAANEYDIVLLPTRENSNIILLGEIHAKTSQALQQGRRVLKHFSWRGLEGFSGNVKPSALYNFAMSLVRIGVLNESLIVKAREQGLYYEFDGENDQLFKDGVLQAKLPAELKDPFRFRFKNPVEGVVNIGIERSTFVKREVEFSCERNHECRGPIISLRDDDMADNIQKILRVKPKSEDLLVIVGSNHVPGLTQRLKCESSIQPILLANTRMNEDWSEINSEPCPTRTKSKIAKF